MRAGRIRSRSTSATVTSASHQQFRAAFDALPEDEAGATHFSHFRADR